LLLPPLSLDLGGFFVPLEISESYQIYLISLVFSY
jgi:hypothetical protein